MMFAILIAHRHRAPAQANDEQIGAVHQFDLKRGYQQTNNPAVLHRRQTQANGFRKCRTSSRPRAAPSVDEECGETLQ